MKLIYYIVVMILMSFSIYNIDSVNAEEPNNMLSESDMVLVDDFKIYSSYGFNNKSLPVYSSEGFIDFNMPFIIRRSVSGELTKDSLSNRIVDISNTFSRSQPVYNFDILDSNKDYYVINYNMIVPASGGFNIDFIPKINNVEYEKYAWWNDSFLNHIIYTIDSEFITGDLYNFPVMLSLDNEPAKWCNGGDSIRFVKMDNVTRYYHEIDSWIDGQDKIVWVNITYISSIVDTKFIMYYNNSLAVSESNPEHTFGNGFVGVWHMNETYGSAPGIDVGNNSGTVHFDIGMIGECRDFEQQDANDHIEYGVQDKWSFGLTKEYTFEAWVKFESFTAPYPILFNAYDTDGYEFYYEDASSRFVLWAGAGSTRLRSFNCDVAIWYHIVLCRVPGDISPNLYVDGSLIGAFDGNSNFDCDGNEFWFGASALVSPNLEFDGLADELRVSNHCRSSHWINATYENVANYNYFISASDSYSGSVEPDPEPEPSVNASNETTSHFTINIDESLLGILLTFVFFICALYYEEKNCIISGALLIFATVISLATGIHYLGFVKYTISWWTGISFLLFAIFCSFLSMYFFMQSNKKQ